MKVIEKIYSTRREESKHKTFHPFFLFENISSPSPSLPSLSQSPLTHFLEDFLETSRELRSGVFQSLTGVLKYACKPGRDFIAVRIQFTSQTNNKIYTIF